MSNGLREIDRLNLKDDQYIIIGDSAISVISWYNKNTANTSLDVLLYMNNKSTPKLNVLLLNRAIPKKENEFLHFWGSDSLPVPASLLYYDSIMVNGYRFMGLKSLYFYYKELYNKTKIYRYRVCFDAVLTELCKNYFAPHKSILVWQPGKITTEFLFKYTILSTINNNKNVSIYLGEDKPTNHNNIRSLDTLDVQLKHLTDRVQLRLDQVGQLISDDILDQKISGSFSYDVKRVVIDYSHLVTTIVDDKSRFKSDARAVMCNQFKSTLSLLRKYNRMIDRNTTTNEERQLHFDLMVQTCAKFIKHIINTETQQIIYRLNGGL